MTARDALNYYFETDRTKASIVHAFVVDTAGVNSAITNHHEAVAYVSSFVHLDTLFTRKLQRVSWDLDFPRWVDCDVDVTKHVFVWRPAAAGAARFLHDKVVELSTTPLGFELPPWQLHFVVDCVGIDGVPDGGTVLLFATHHSAIDGMGIVDLFNRILSPNPNPNPNPAPDHHEPLPSPIPTRLAALRTLPAGLARFGQAIILRTKANRALPATAGTDVVAARKHVNRPATRFNRNTAPDMVMDLAWFDLGRAKRVKAAFGGVTLNDVLMTVISLAMSEYLREDGELPDESLATSIPMNTRTITESEFANQITVVTLSLHTDIADPADRLAAVHASAVEAKKLGTVLTTSLPPNPLIAAPAPVLKALTKVIRSQPADPTSVHINTMITNIAYGAGPLTVSGAPVLGVFAPLMNVEGVQISHAIMTLGNSLALSVASNAALMPDVSRYVKHLVRAFERLETASAMVVPAAAAHRHAG